MTQDLETKNLQLVQALFDATGKGDWAAAENMLTSDFSVTEAGTLPFAGTYHGRGALQELFTLVMSAAGVTGLDIEQLTAGGDRVVALLEMGLGGPPRGSRAAGGNLPLERRQGLRDPSVLFRPAPDYRGRRGAQARSAGLTGRSRGKEQSSAEHS